MVAAARRVFHVSDHNPVERFADLDGSLTHPESYLPGETPTPQPTAVVNAEVASETSDEEAS
jgi:hypothetical protein